MMSTSYPLQVDCSAKPWERLLSCNAVSLAFYAQQNKALSQIMLWTVMTDVRQCQVSRYDWQWWHMSEEQQQLTLIMSSFIGSSEVICSWHSADMASMASSTGLMIRGNCSERKCERLDQSEGQQLLTVHREVKVSGLRCSINLWIVILTLHTCISETGLIIISHCINVR